MKTFTIELDERGMQALSFVVDTALKGSGVAAHGAATVVLAAMERAVKARQQADVVEAAGRMPANGLDVAHVS